MATEKDVSAAEVQEMINKVQDELQKVVTSLKECQSESTIVSDQIRTSYDALATDWKDFSDLCGEAQKQLLQVRMSCVQVIADYLDKVKANEEALRQKAQTNRTNAREKLEQMKSWQS